MTRVCAWCKAGLGETADPTPGITDGICPACDARLRAEAGLPAAEGGAAYDEILSPAANPETAIPLSPEQERRVIHALARWLLADVRQESPLLTGRENEDGDEGP